MREDRICEEIYMPLKKGIDAYLDNEKQKLLEDLNELSLLKSSFNENSNLDKILLKLQDYVNNGRDNMSGTISGFVSDSLSDLEKLMEKVGLVKYAWDEDGYNFTPSGWAYDVTSGGLELYEKIKKLEVKK